MNFKDGIEWYKNEGYLEVEGWGVDRDLIELFILFDEFQKNLGITGPLTEIGVHYGRTLILLGLIARKDEVAVGVDLFEEGQNQNIDFSGSGSYLKLMNNIKRFAPEANFLIIPSNSFAIPKNDLYKMKNSRIFHIDGGHFLEV